MAKMKIAQVRKAVKAKLMNTILNVAKPWEPITDEHLSAKELLLLLGIDAETKHYQYLKYLRFCRIAAAYPGDNHHSLPYNLRDCFAGGAVKVEAFKSQRNLTRSKIEYRVAIADLRKDRQLKALDIVLERIGESLRLNKKARLALRTLAHQKNEPVSQVISSLVVNAVPEAP